ncbi:hypothetical protein ILUMI_24594 [Ignelater luminosus]|uniref:Uncharacterized protein n=1 Tax=Ignelater luminosus TaxID=2038154 RepID=A0A8K0G0H6_IGNLU|nr:hypothetical protein ILUMI_24594 [Ignelater luminosus]
MQRFGKLHYLVKLDGDEYSLKRHVNQLLRVTINLQPKKKVTFASFLPSNIHPHDNDEQGRGPPVEFQQEPPEVHLQPLSILRQSVRERRPQENCKTMMYPLYTKLVN